MGWRQHLPHWNYQKCVSPKMATDIKKRSGLADGVSMKTEIEHMARFTFLIT